jgi:predicted  nucleic acid-binding Zn-ribbon protein
MELLRVLIWPTVALVLGVGGLAFAWLVRGSIREELDGLQAQLSRLHRATDEQREGLAELSAQVSADRTSRAAELHTRLKALEDSFRAGLLEVSEAHATTAKRVHNMELKASSPMDRQTQVGTAALKLPAALRGPSK